MNPYMVHAIRLSAAIVVSVAITSGGSMLIHSTAVQQMLQQLKVML